MVMNMRIEQSTDIHRLVKGRDLILGGVKIPYELGLLGHSDADVLLHAITEAIIGAMALSDLGRHFPDNDDKYKDISSMILLEKTARMMRENGYRIGNIDSLVIIQEPKLKDYIPEMVTNIARVLQCDESRVNVKATTGEHLGFVGNKEGVVSQAVVLLEEV